MTTGGGGPKTRFGTQVPADVVASVRGAVRAMQQKFGPEFTLSSFTTDALREHVRRMEVDHNGGKPFEATQAYLVPGRRVGAGESDEGGDEGGG